MDNELKEVVKKLIEALRNDPAYRESWKANIAMAFQDEWNDCMRKGSGGITSEFLHMVANSAADRFLNHLTFFPSDNVMDLPGALQASIVGAGLPMPQKKWTDGNSSKKHWD